MVKREVRAEIEVHVRPEEVFRAFTNVQMLRQWWGVNRGLVEEREGGVWGLAWGVGEQGFRYVTTGVIRSFRPYRQIEIDNLVYFNPERPVLGPMHLSIGVHEGREETLVSILQDGYQQGADWDWYYQAVVVGWPHALTRLKEYLEAGPA